MGKQVAARFFIIVLVLPVIRGYRYRYRYRYRRLWFLMADKIFSQMIVP